MSNLSITAGSAPSQSTPIRKGATAASCAIAILSMMLFTASTGAAPLLWNQLGSNAQVTNSAYGPNLGFYGGGGWPDVIGNPGYNPGVFGGALTVGAGTYGTYDRVHNVVWNNVDQYLSPERGTIDVWFKQTQNPADYAHGIYRIFDGAYGLGSGVGIWSDANGGLPTLAFSAGFGGTPTGVTYNISAHNGTWIHLAGVWDRAGIDGSLDTLRLYVNGAVAASSNVSTWGTVVGQQADIGGGNDGDIAGKFAIDNLKVHDVAITDFSNRFDESAIPEPSAVAMLLALGVAPLCRRRRR